MWSAIGILALVCILWWVWAALLQVDDDDERDGEMLEAIAREDYARRRRG
jgi:uncharacterized membrane protein